MNHHSDLHGFIGESRPGESAESNLVTTLRRFRQERPIEERCELCGAKLAASHRHLLEVSRNRIACSCDPCALRFQDVLDGRFRLVPRDVWRLNEMTLTDQEWDLLALPIGLAFFFYSTPEKKMKAMYPSPAGATESLLPLPAWKVFAERNPRLTNMQPDVEAFLVNRVKSQREYYIVPIDTCFELVGLIRIHWRGLSGGETAWREVESLFARLSTQARPEPNVS